MLSVQQVDSILQERGFCVKSNLVPLEVSGNRILSQDIVADRDLPPYNRVAMDGIAIQWQQWQGGQSSFPISHVQKAGAEVTQLLESQQCIEVMTGAILPFGCDCVVRYEDLKIIDGIATINEMLSLEQWQNVHRQGSDRLQGQVLIEKNMQLQSPMISICASVGVASVEVSPTFKIAVISTGDELVEVASEPKPHQIRRSNSYGIVQLVQEFALGVATQHHIKDEEQILREKLNQLLSENDVLILSGGVSMGKFDFIPSVLKQLGVTEIFHKIAQKPGKPMWFGVTANKKLIFALPGNPVSALVCMRRYVVPKLMLEMQASPRKIFAVLAHNFKNLKEMTHFVPVKYMSEETGMIVVNEVALNGSGDFSGLGQSDGFVELAASGQNYQAGDVVPLWLWRAL